MKLKRTAAMLIAATVFLVLFACGTTIDKYEGSISELRTNVYTAKSDTLKVSAITGRRESPYVLDGHCEGTQDFTVITVEPAVYDASKEYSYKAVINGTEYSGAFLPHPFGKSYSADISAQCELDIITCTVIFDGTQESFELNTVKSEEMIDAQKAFQISCNRLKSQIDSLEANGRLNAEIYIRLMENPIDNNGGYYWYVAFIGEAQTIYACLIDPVSMEILASRE